MDEETLFREQREREIERMIEKRKREEFHRRREKISKVSQYFWRSHQKINLRWLLDEWLDLTKRKAFRRHIWKKSFHPKVQSRFCFMNASYYQDFAKTINRKYCSEIVQNNYCTGLFLAAKLFVRNTKLLCRKKKQQRIECLLFRFPEPIANLIESYITN
jgi:hypothetical protein